MSRLLEAAVRNNAAWCAAVCAAHGIPSTTGADLWWAERRSPPLHPDAVTLTPSVDAGAVLARIDADPGASVKDSFATVDLAPAGFEVLLDGSWVAWEPPSSPGVAPWAAVERAGLPGWVARWGDGPLELYPDAVLGAPGVAFVLGPEGGASLLRAAGVVGVTNLFADDGDLEQAWAGVLATAADQHPGLPVVAWEAGAPLASARAAGATSLGALRVWQRP